jgi:hypothetical protein
VNGATRLSSIGRAARSEIKMSFQLQREILDRQKNSRFQMKEAFQEMPAYDHKYGKCPYLLIQEHHLEVVYAAVQT